jgi:hypothetical protein
MNECSDLQHQVGSKRFEVYHANLVPRVLAGTFLGLPSRSGTIFTKPSQLREYFVNMAPDPLNTCVN